MKTPIVACLQTRLEHYARRKRRNRGKFSHPQQKHHFIKREIDSMNDCFEFMEEPLYGFRVKVTQEIECSKLGPNCGMPSNSTDKDNQFDVRQSGENFSSDAPPDCRITTCS